MITKNGKKVLRILTTFKQQALAGFNTSIPVALTTVKDITNADVNVASIVYNSSYTEGGITYYRPSSAGGTMSGTSASGYASWNLNLSSSDTRYYNATSTALNNATGDSSGMNILLGDGTTPATEDDYALESPLHSYTVGSNTVNPSLTRGRVSCYVDDDYSVVRYMCYNNTNYDISFSELGLINKFNGIGSSTSLTGVILMGRWVFNTITVQPGESIEILLKIPIPSLS